LIREICRTQDIEILQGHVRPEHVHLLLSVPPHLSPSRVMQAIKGKTSHHLLQDRRSCGRSSGVGTCGRVAISCAAAGTSRTR
jgi:REP element-mobilizing transposase RayT